MSYEPDITQSFNLLFRNITQTSQPSVPKCLLTFLRGYFVTQLFLLFQS